MKKSPIERRTPIKKVNRKRKAKREAEHFGDKAKWVRTLVCLVCGRYPVQACHAKSRGAGGTAEHLVPMCVDHHRQQHQMGIDTFGALYNVDLMDEARHYEQAWQEKERGEWR